MLESLSLPSYISMMLLFCMINVISIFVLIFLSFSDDNMVTSCNENIVDDFFQKNRQGCNSTENARMNKACTM